MLIALIICYTCFLEKGVLNFVSFLVPLQQVNVVRWASKKAGGSTRNGRKSAGKRLGLKCGNGKKVYGSLESILQDTRAFSGYINKTRLDPGLNDVCYNAL